MMNICAYIYIYILINIYIYTFISGAILGSVGAHAKPASSLMAPTLAIGLNDPINLRLPLRV